MSWWASSSPGKIDGLTYDRILQDARDGISQSTKSRRDNTFQGAKRRPEEPKLQLCHTQKRKKNCAIFCVPPAIVEFD
jgi:hypothetical protein